MDPEVKLEYFADAAQDALAHWIAGYLSVVGEPGAATATNEDMDDEFAKKSATTTFGWIRTEGILRLSQSLINILRSPSVPTSRIVWLYSKFFSKSTADEAELSRRLCQLLDPFIHPQLEPYETAWIGHRNVCLVLTMILDKCPNLFPRPQTSDQLVDYLVKILDQTNCPETNLWALMVLEKLALAPKRFSPDRVPKVIQKLKCLSGSLELLGTRFYKMDFDYTGYQVAFAAKWLLEHVFQGEVDAGTSSPTVKMLAGDRFTARSDSSLFPPVRSGFCISRGVFYYELVLLSDGPLRVGWASNQCDFEHNEVERLGDDEYSIALDGAARCIWYERKQYPVKCSRGGSYSWKAGDVVGVLLDLEEKKFAFYLNGAVLQHRKKLAKKFGKLVDGDFIEESTRRPAFFAAASLGPHQQCFFNFGQQPFAYPPKDAKFANFHTSCDQDPRRYQLLETALAGGSYWFKQPLIDNRVEPLIRDVRQKDFNRWVKELESRVAEDDYDYEYLYGELKWEFEALMRDELAYCRLIQAVIRKLGSMVREDQYGVVVGWIMYYLSSLDDTLSSGGRDLPEIWFFDKSDVDSNVSSPNLPAPAKFLEMIYPYMQLGAKCDRDVIHIRNTCAALSILARKYLYLSDFLDREVVSFLSRILSESQDNCSLLFTLICLDHLSMDQRVKSQICQKTSRIQNLAKYLDQLTVGSIYEANFDPARYQLAFCARWCLDYVLVDDLEAKPRDSVKDGLNSESRTEQMKLSPDQLSARSDDGWQSVRSSCAVTSGVYYYEVILITPGPMRIGWTTGDTDFYKSNLGDNKQSIGLDRYQRCIWHDADRFKIKSLPGWAPGDVIGCLIDVPSEKFTFYLNGKAIATKKQFFKKFNFESEPYYAAVTLWPHQQCCFNFGQAPFRYPPPGVAFRDFHSTSVSSSTASSPSVVKHSILRRRLLDMLPGVAPKVVAELNPHTIK